MKLAEALVIRADTQKRQERPDHAQAMVAAAP
jgi:hypothetical protein